MEMIAALMVFPALPLSKNIFCVFKREDIVIMYEARRLQHELSDTCIGHFGPRLHLFILHWIKKNGHYIN